MFRPIEEDEIEPDENPYEYEDTNIQSSKPEKDDFILVTHQVCNTFTSSLMLIVERIGRCGQLCSFKLLNRSFLTIESDFLIRSDLMLQIQSYS